MHEKMGRVEEAKKNYLKAIEINGEYLDALIGLARIFTESKTYNEAAPLLKRALEIDPENSEARRLVTILVTETQPKF